MIVADSNSFARMVAKEVDHAHMNRNFHMERLSSGKKINSSRDDLGALSNLIKQTSQSRRSVRLQQAFQNAISYTQVQTGALNEVSGIYKRMAELATLAMDPTKTDRDRENYDREFQELREQVLQIDVETFNDQPLFRNTVYAIFYTSGNVSWEDARQLAADASEVDPEYEHYLATITSVEEQQEVDRQLGSANVGIALWLGGSDAHTEGEWRWVEGPEGLEEGGLGRQFWQGAGVGAGGYAVNGAYENWNDPNEPNDSGGREDALQILSTDGEWNDLVNNFPSAPVGYLRESDPKNLRIGDDPFGGYFEMEKIAFKRFLPSTTIDLKTISNAKDALFRVNEAVENVIDKIGVAGSNESRLHHELRQIQADYLEREKSLSRIVDLDVARAATAMAKEEIKMQSSATVFAQANQLFSKRNYVEELL